MRICNTPRCGSDSRTLAVRKSFKMGTGWYSSLSLPFIPCETVTVRASWCHGLQQVLSCVADTAYAAQDAATSSKRQPSSPNSTSPAPLVLLSSSSTSVPIHADDATDKAASAFRSMNAPERPSDATSNAAQTMPRLSALLLMPCLQFPPDATLPCAVRWRLTRKLSDAALLRSR